MGRFSVEEIRSNNEGIRDIKYGDFDLSEGRKESEGRGDFDVLLEGQGVGKSDKLSVFQSSALVWEMKPYSSP